jgi:hypothetical protein
MGRQQDEAAIRPAADYELLAAGGAPSHGLARGLLARELAATAIDRLDLERHEPDLAPRVALATGLSAGQEKP